MKLDPSEYYSRMRQIPEFGNKAPKRLQSAHVTIVGAGGVGSTVASYLSRMGVGHLRIIDQDIVEPTNLHRLQGATREHLYHPKAETAAETLTKSNPWTSVEPIVDTLRPSNADELLAGSDLIVDGLDNFKSRYLVNQHAHRTATAYLFTSAIAQQCHLALFTLPRTACLECVMPNVPDRPEESCEALGITPTTVAIVGALAADQATKMILGIHTKLEGQLLTIDTMTLEFILSPVSKSPTCNTCSKPKTKSIFESGIVTELCGNSGFNVVPERPLNLDLRNMRRSLPTDSVLEVTKTVLVYKKGGIVISLFSTGRLLIGGIGRKDEALELAKNVWDEAMKEIVELPRT